MHNHASVADARRRNDVLIVINGVRKPCYDSCNKNPPQHNAHSELQSVVAMKVLLIWDNAMSKQSFVCRAFFLVEILLIKAVQLEVRKQSRLLLLIKRKQLESILHHKHLPTSFSFLLPPSPLKVLQHIQVTISFFFLSSTLTFLLLFLFITTSFITYPDSEGFCLPRRPSLTKLWKIILSWCTHCGWLIKQTINTAVLLWKGNV